jgi:hypothetical protein
MNSITPDNVKLQGLFTGQRLVQKAPHSRDNGLLLFLTRDAGQSVLYKEYSVHGRKIALSLRSHEGRVIELYGLGGKNKVFAAIRQEMIAGREVKVLYGWAELNDWGKEENILLKYILAERAGGEWRLLSRPESLTGPLRRQQAIDDNKALAKALTGGLGGSVLRRVWLISPKSDRITFLFDYRLIIHGFHGYRSVFSLTREEAGKIVVRFYADAGDADKGERLLKMAVLSERGTNGRWTPLPTPRLLFSAPGSSVNQHRYLMARQTKQFLLDNQERGAIFDVGQRTVSNGAVLLPFLNDCIRLNGLSGYKSVAGRIVNQEKTKVIYFWPDEAAKQSGAPPIFPQGQTVARQTDGHWEIVWFDLSQGYRQAALGSIKLGNFIFANAGARLHVVPWPIRNYSNNGEQRQFAQRRIRGKNLTVATSGTGVINGRVLSQTREIGGRLKLIEFWPNEQEIARRPPFAARFIAVNQNGHDEQKRADWAIFWHRVDSSADTVGAFRQLLRQGIVAHNELSAILCDDYFSGYPIQGLIDTLLI